MTSTERSRKEQMMKWTDPAFKEKRRLRQATYRQRLKVCEDKSKKSESEKRKLRRYAAKLSSSIAPQTPTNLTGISKAVLNRSSKRLAKHQSTKSPLKKNNARQLLLEAYNLTPTKMKQIDDITNTLTSTTESTSQETSSRPTGEEMSVEYTSSVISTPNVCKLIIRKA